MHIFHFFPALVSGAVLLGVLAQFAADDSHGKEYSAPQGVSAKSIAKWVRRSVFFLFFLGGAWLLAFGPRPDADEPKDRVIIHYWEKWIGDEAQKMQYIVKDFNDTLGAQKGIYVEYLSMSTVDQKTAIATAAGVPPDVAGLWQGQVAQFSALHAFMPLDDLVAKHNASDTRDPPITDGYYKPVYWNACHYDGHLYALISTPAAVTLHYNKKMFMDKADKLRAAGCDPTRAPRTLKEFDAYAKALDEYDSGKHLICAGYVPLEPGWYIAETPYWFGGNLFDAQTQQFTLTSPECIASMGWVKSYSVKLGKDALSDFRQGFGGSTSAQSPFMTGQVAMVQQGPWMANFIEMGKPSMSGRWIPENGPKPLTGLTGTTADASPIVTMSDTTGVTVGMTVTGTGIPVATLVTAISPNASITLSANATAAVSGVDLTFSSRPIDPMNGKPVITKEEELTLPVAERQSFYEWGVAPFPSVFDDKFTNPDDFINKGATFCDFDILAIPRGCKHPEEAFEFIAFVNTQKEMEKLCASHCKNTPLAVNSPNWLRSHPNPYIDIFERLAASPNAKAVPSIPIWPEVNEEVGSAVQRITLLKQEPADAMAEAQQRLEEKLTRYKQMHGPDRF